VTLAGRCSAGEAGVLTKRAFSDKNNKIHDREGERDEEKGIPQDGIRAGLAQAQGP